MFEFLMEDYTHDELSSILCRVEASYFDNLEEVGECLIELGLSHQEIKVTILDNPRILMRSRGEIEELAAILESYESLELDEAIKENPYILNRDAREIRDSIESMRRSGYTIDEAINQVLTSLN